MTNKEAIEWFRSSAFYHKDHEPFNMAIKALEQEPILDKIRAEIIAKDKNVKAIRSDGCCFFTADEILNILNKYKEESEE